MRWIWILWSLWGVWCGALPLHFAWNPGPNYPAGITYELQANGASVSGITATDYWLDVPIQRGDTVDARVRAIPPPGFQCGDPPGDCLPSDWGTLVATLPADQPAPIYSATILDAQAPPMALAKTDRLSWSTTNPGTNSATTSSFTAADNSLLVVAVYALEYNATSNPMPSLTLTASNGSPVQHVSQVGPTSYQFYGIAFYTVAITTGGSMTLTVDCGSVNIWAYAIQVFEFTGHDTSAPVGATASGTDADGTGAASITLSAAPAAGSYVIAAAGIPTNNSSATSEVVPDAAWTEIYDLAPASQYFELQSQYRTASTSTTVAWSTLGTSHRTEGAALAAIEIKESGGAAAFSFPAFIPNRFASLIVR